MDTDEFSFYYGVASGGSIGAMKRAQRPDTVSKDGEQIDLSTYPSPEKLMISYMNHQNELWPGPEWAIDCGGFSALAENAEYPTSNREYIEWIANQEQKEGVDIDWFALRDYVCPPDLLRKHNRTTEDHQLKTLRAHIECHDLALEHSLSANPVAVLQGYDIRDYLSFLDDLRDHGLLTDRLGIGSILRGYNSLSEVSSTIVRIRDAVPDRVDLHGFGLKHGSLQASELFAVLDSADSTNWHRYARYEMNSGRWTDILNSYKRYRQDLLDLQVSNEQPSIEHAQPETKTTDNSNVKVRMLSDFGTSSYLSVGCIHLECICGTKINPREISEDGESDPDPGCRFCEQTILNIWNQRHIIGHERARARRIAREHGPEAQSFRPVSQEHLEQSDGSKDSMKTTVKPH